MFIQSKASTGSSNSLIIRHSDLNTISINYIHQCIDTGHLQGHYFSGDLPIFTMTGQLSAWMAIVVFCCTTVVIDVASGASPEDYKRLHRSLLANYSTSVRPRRNSLYLHCFIPSWDQRCRYCRSTPGHNCFP